MQVHIESGVYFGRDRYVGSVVSGFSHVVTGSAHIGPDSYRVVYSLVGSDRIGLYSGQFGLGYNRVGSCWNTTGCKRVQPGCNGFKSIISGRIHLITF